MQLTKIRIKNYRLLIDAELEVDPKMTLIVGRNNTAKTSCFSCIGNFVPATKKRSARMHTRAVVLVQRERLCYSKKRCVSAAEMCRHSGKPKCTCTAEERIIRGILQQ